MRWASGQGDIVTIGDTSASDTVADPSNATAQYVLINDGEIHKITHLGTVVSTWLVPGTNAGDYEVFATLNSGTLSGTFGSWLNLGSNRGWSATRLTLGTTSGNFDIQIRRVVDSVVMDSATITLTATVESGG